MISENADYSTTKEETNTNDTTARISNAVSSSSTSSWSRLKDPRIVRVSRAFGGKDRHSKVCTIRGLRDRRVRLSVPTAIQLYDLQDRLGLNQPSKVVDWLLNEAKHAIDELPPLQIPQGSLMSQSLHHPMFMNSHPHEFLAPQSDKGLKINSSGINWGKAKDVSGETSHHRHHENWRREADNEEESSSQLQLDQNNRGFDSSTTNTALSRQSISFPSLLNASLPYNPFVRWDPSNMTLSHDPQRSHHESSTSQNNEEYHHHHPHHNFSLVQLPSIPAGSHPVLVYHQPGMGTTQAFNAGPSHQISATNTEFESKQVDFHSLQLSNSSLASPVDHSNAQPHVRPFQFSMAANLMPSQNNAVVDEQNNNNRFHSS